jgi:hypothetical protein
MGLHNYTAINLTKFLLLASLLQVRLMEKVHYIMQRSKVVTRRECYLVYATILK